MKKQNKTNQNKRKTKHSNNNITKQKRLNQLLLGKNILRNGPRLDPRAPLNKLAFLLTRESWKENKENMI